MADNDSAPEKVVHIIDARGLACPLPVLKLRKALAREPCGMIVELLATDRTAVRDVPAFCKVSGHHLVSTDQENGVLRFVIRRA